VLANILWLLPALEAIQGTITQNHFTVASRARESVDQFFNFNVVYLRTLASDIGSNPLTVRQELEISMRDNVAFQRLTFLNQEGFEVSRIDRFGFEALESASRKAEEAVIVAFSGESFIGPVFFEKGEPLTTIYVPIMTERREVIGVLESQLRFRTVWNAMETISRESGSRVFLVDNEGTRVADPDPSVVLQRENLMVRDVVRTIVGPGKDVALSLAQGVYEDENGTSVFGVGVPYKKLGWGVFVETPADALFSARNKIIFLFILGTFILLVIVLWSSSRVTNLVNSLDEKRRQTNAIISHLTDGLIQYDKDFAVILINDTAERLLGVRSDDILGRIFSPKDSKKKEWSSLVGVLFPVIAEDAHIVSSGDKETKITELKIEYPVARDLQVVTVPVTDEEGGTGSYLKVIRDISYEKVIARAKTEFLSLAAHQLRTPLSAIKWTLDFLLGKDAEPLTEEQRKFLEGAFASNDRMIKLIDALLNVSRIEEGRFGYEFEPGDIVSLVENIISGLMPISNKAGVALKFTKPELVIPPLMFDKERMRFAIGNLIDNAVRYSRKDASDSFVTVAVRDTEDFVEVEVSDNGIGIPQEHVPHLFEKFSRAVNAQKATSEGSGLGLFIVKNIIVRHGGDIRVESQENRGTHFIVTIPKDPTKIPPAEKTFEE